MIKDSKKNLYLILVILALIGLISCSRILPKGFPYPHKKKGVYHIVKKGETLWGISNLYHVDLEEIIRANRISDPKRITIGQKLFIPRAKKPLKAKIHSPKIEEFIWPIKGKIISYFGVKEKKKNNGIDISVSGEGHIVAIASGKIIFSDFGPEGYGKMIMIKHRFGFVSLYSNQKENLVTVNQIVRQGEKIARIEKTKDKEEPYLHLEIRKNRIPRDPLLYLP
jgi:murein DD-endopeptidase MepM/ murein hydrolase activator NlpD